MEETRLLDSLQHKLTELDHKVQAYRHEVAIDFLRYYQDLLRDIPLNVTFNIRRSLVNSLSDYPALSPALNLSLGLDPPDSDLDSRALARPGLGQLNHSLPVAHPDSGLASGLAESPGPSASNTTSSAHPRPPGTASDRHHLQGLFTPTYLPLLESSPKLPTSFPAVGQSSLPSIMVLPAPGIRDEARGPDSGSWSPLQDSHESKVEPVSQSPSRPSYARQSTDDTTSSAHSERSESRTPRSALRRSSNSSKPPQSPRRVRFEFMGAEVLPTVSPRPTDFMIPPPAQANPSDREPTNSMLGDELGCAPPRKISSSEALRALSRTPLEEGTVWTVVNSNPNEILVQQEDLDTPSTSHVEERSNPMPIAPEPPPSMYVSESVMIERTLGSVSEDLEEDIDQDDSSDEEFLSMAKPKSFSNKKAPNSPQPKSTADRESASSVTNPKASATSQISIQTLQQESIDNLDDDDDDDDDMFQFDAGGLSAPPKPRPQPPPAKEEEEAEVELPDVPESQQSLYATSPAVHIAQPSVLSGPTTPTTARFQAGSLGSYKGRPVIMPVVRNPQVHAQAASLGQFNTFVGGLDGRSGMDEGDLSSFRASVANNGFSGTPRSFTERLMMEDAQRSRHGNGRLS